MPCRDDGLGNNSTQRQAAIESSAICRESWLRSQLGHRAELTALERDEQVARWIELAAQRVSRQADAKPKGGRPEGGRRAAAREIGVSEPDARRAVKVAKLSDEAKAAARDNSRLRAESIGRNIAPPPPHEEAGRPGVGSTTASPDRKHGVTHVHG